MEIKTIRHIQDCHDGLDCPLIPKWRKDTYPLRRYQYHENYYFLMTNPLMDLESDVKIEVMIVEDKEVVNDFLLGAGLKTIETFYAETPIRALNKAKAFIKTRSDYDG